MIYLCPSGILRFFFAVGEKCVLWMRMEAQKNRVEIEAQKYNNKKVEKEKDKEKKTKQAVRNHLRV